VNPPCSGREPALLGSEPALRERGRERGREPALLGSEIQPCLGGAQLAAAL